MSTSLISIFPPPRHSTPSVVIIAIDVERKRKGEGDDRDNNDNDIDGSNVAIPSWQRIRIYPV